MLKRILLSMVVVLFAILVCIEAKGGGGGGNKKAKANNKGGQGKDCSDWTYADCIPQGDAACGKGSKKGTRTGDNCSVKEKSFVCRIPCVKNKCKYQKGEWSECDLATNMMTRTNTLKKGDPATCQASKVITKKCKNKKTNVRQNRRHRKPPQAASD